MPSTAPARRQRPPFPPFEAPASFEEMAAGPAPSNAASSDRPEPDAPADGVDAVVTCVCSQPPLRETLYKTLAHCAQPRPFAEVEAFISSQDEFVFSHIEQTPHTLIGMLVDAGGLVRTPLDAQGKPLTPELLAGLSQDEADDLVASFELATTPEGRAAVELLSPQRRIAAQLAQKPHRRPTYLALLSFCREPRTLAQIEAFFADNPDLALDQVTAYHHLSPDYYVDRLEKAGALVWRGAWVTTQAGLDALAGADVPRSQ